MCSRRNKYKTPLLDRRGAETDERSESDEAGWWNSYTRGLCHPERSEGTRATTPPPDTRFARPGSTPPVQEGTEKVPLVKQRKRFCL